MQFLRKGSLEQNLCGERVLAGRSCSYTTPFYFKKNAVRISKKSLFDCRYKNWILVECMYYQLTHTLAFLHHVAQLHFMTPHQLLIQGRLSKEQLAGK
jgi:hypothetical protein